MDVGISNWDKKSEVQSVSPKEVSERCPISVETIQLSPSWRPAWKILLKEEGEVEKSFATGLLERQRQGVYPPAALATSLQSSPSSLFGRDPAENVNI